MDDELHSEENVNSSNDGSNPQVFTAKVSDKVTNLAGIDKLEGFNIKEFFEDVFKKNTTDEIEEYFTVGTKSTTPNINDVNTN